MTKFTGRITGQIPAGSQFPNMVNFEVTVDFSEEILLLEDGARQQEVMTIPGDISQTDTEIEAALREAIAAVLTERYVGGPFTTADIRGCKL